MPFIERHPDGRIKGTYAQLQPGYAEEWSEQDYEFDEAGDALPLILQSLHSRIEALEGRGFAEDEDPGEQPEIFTEEDVEALGAVAVESEASQDADTPAAPAPDTEGLQGVVNPDAGAAGSPAYPGIMTLPDELGARRNAVLAAIATEKLTRLSIAMDPSRADFLAARFTEYQNAGALGLAIDDGLLADRDAFLAMKDRTDRITAYALSLERAAIEADSDMLSAMHAGLGDGWP